MAKYRKKPVVIDAEQFCEDQKPWPPGVLLRSWGFELHDFKPNEFFMELIDARYKVCEGDWIIMEGNGDRHPCKPDIFEATYELVV